MYVYIVFFHLLRMDYSHSKDKAALRCNESQLRQGKRALELGSTSASWAVFKCPIVPTRNKSASLEQRTKHQHFSKLLSNSCVPLCLSRADLQLHRTRGHRGIILLSLIIQPSLFLALLVVFTGMQSTVDTYIKDKIFKINKVHVNMI